MKRIWLALAALNGAIAVVVGAFAAHGLQSVLTSDRLGWVDTAARYQMTHALALFAVAWLAEQRGGLASHFAGGAFALGIVLFCGGLYLAGLGEITFPMPAVPIGGMLFVIGWLAVLAAALSGWRQ